MAILRVDDSCPAVLFRRVGVTQHTLYLFRIKMRRMANKAVPEGIAKKEKWAIKKSLARGNGYSAHSYAEYCNTRIYN